MLLTPSFFRSHSWAVGAALVHSKHEQGYKQLLLRSMIFSSSTKSSVTNHLVNLSNVFYQTNKNINTLKLFLSTFLPSTSHLLVQSKSTLFSMVTVKCDIQVLKDTRNLKDSSCFSCV